MKAFDSVIGWIKENSVASMVLVIAVVFSAILVGCSGFKLTDWVKVDVPPGVQKTVGTPSVITLTEASMVWVDWVDEVEKESEKFATNIEEAQSRYTILSSLFTTGMEFTEEGIKNSGLPMGGVLATALGAIALLFVPKPGTAAKIKEAEDRGWDMAAKEITEHVKTNSPSNTTNSAALLESFLEEYMKAKVASSNPSTT